MLWEQPWPKHRFKQSQEMVFWIKMHLFSPSELRSMPRNKADNSHKMMLVDTMTVDGLWLFLCCSTVYSWEFHLLWLLLCKSHSIRVRIICKNYRAVILISSLHCKVLCTKLQITSQYIYSFKWQQRLLLQSLWTITCMRCGCFYASLSLITPTPPLLLPCHKLINK